MADLSVVPEMPVCPSWHGVQKQVEVHNWGAFVNGLIRLTGQPSWADRCEVWAGDYADEGEPDVVISVMAFDSEESERIAHLIADVLDRDMDHSCEFGWGKR